MDRHFYRTLTLVLVLTALSMLMDVPVASSQGLGLVAALIEDDLPIEAPDSPLWDLTTAVEVPLSAQKIIFPYLQQPSLRSVTARALHNGSQIAILVEWADASRNDEAIHSDNFRDAVALQFPLTETQPFFCMGQHGGNVNIWHWKADWQAELSRRQDVDTAYPDMYVDYYPFANGAAAQTAVEDYTDMNYLPAAAAGNLLAIPSRPSSVEDLIAGGYGTMTAQPIENQDVHGSAEWKTDTWRVVFSRQLQTGDTEDVQFVPGNVYSIAFAAWDGEQQERNGQKSTSQWLTFSLEEPAPVLTRPPRSRDPNVELWPLLLLGLVILVAAFLVKLAKANP